MLSFKNFLLEKLIVFDNGANYGQVVIMAGAGGSGKGYAIENFVDSSKFKVLDVDKLKTLVLQLGIIKNDPELKHLKLSNKNDVSFLHQYVKDKKFFEKLFKGIVSDARSDRLPNILFDVTLSEYTKMKGMLNTLLEIGYDANNIHLVWVLTNHEIALKRNAGRKRYVDPEVIKKAQIEVSTTMASFVKKFPEEINGRFVVILNNDEAKTEYGNSSVVKDFTYINVKKPGNPVILNNDIKEKLKQWTTENMSKDALTKFSI